MIDLPRLFRSHHPLRRRRLGIPRTFSAEVDGHAWVNTRPSENGFVGVFVAPFAHHIGQARTTSGRKGMRAPRM
jgi:hypothetical protein